MFSVGNLDFTAVILAPANLLNLIQTVGKNSATVSVFSDLSFVSFLFFLNIIVKQALIKYFLSIFSLGRLTDFSNLVKAGRQAKLPCHQSEGRMAVQIIPESLEEPLQLETRNSPLLLAWHAQNTSSLILAKVLRLIEKLFVGQLFNLD